MSTNVPVFLTSFVGRSQELRDVSDLLRRSDVRLVTLTGPGGVGKTRLATQVARDLGPDYPDGVWFVPLASIRNAELVATTVAHVLSVRESGTQTIEAEIEEKLRDRRALLVLDNFEQVRTASPLLTRLLSTCPRLTILVTSRIILGVSGEHVVDVPPLATPSHDGSIATADVTLTDAVHLFVDRARAARHPFNLNPETISVAASICTRLDGLPLAIELAAARVKVLPLPALLERLERRLPLLTGGHRDLPQRQQTMRDTIAWSYELLSPAEQALFRRLAVFSGGFTLEAAESVARDGSLSLSVFDGIVALVDNSLVRQQHSTPGQPRYHMLETMREFALERLEEHGEVDETRQRHAAFFQSVAEQATLDPVAANNLSRLELLAADHDNLRAACDHLCRAETAEGCLRLVAGCAQYWFTRGHIREGRSRLNEAIAIARTAAPSAAKGHALAWAGQFAISTRHFDEAAAFGEQGVAVWNALDDPYGRTMALLAVASLEEIQLHWANAAVLFDEVVASWRALGKRFELGQALALRSGVAFGQGDLDLAVSLAEEAAALFREIGHRSWEALTEWYLGMFAAERSQLPEAIRRFRTSAHTFIEAGDSVWLYKPLVGLAAVAVALHQAECAARLLGAVDAQLQQTGAQLLPFDSPAHARAERGARDALSDADFDLAYQSGSTLSVAELVSEIDRVGDGGPAIETAEKAQVVDPGKASHGLTARELDVLRLIAEGRTDREIAEALFLSYRTVTSYVTSILGKLSVDSRTAAATQAIRRGLV